MAFLPYRPIVFDAYICLYVVRYQCLCDGTAECHVEHKVHHISMHDAWRGSRAESRVRLCCLVVLGTRAMLLDLRRRVCNSTIESN
jgi:hypothetical protein